MQMHSSTVAIATAEPWETVPGLQVTKVVEAFARLGIDVAHTLSTFGIPAGVSIDTPVPFRQASAWMDHVLTTFPQRGLGLQFADLLTQLDQGIVGYTILSSETLGTAIAERVRFSALLRPYFGMALRDAGEGMSELMLIERDPPLVSARTRAFFMERDLAMWAGATRRMIGPGQHTEAVHCAYPDPQLRDRYYEVFGCPTRFDQPVSLVRFRTSLLETPMRHAHGEAHAICEGQCDALLARMREGLGTATTLRRLMLRRPKQLPDLETAAADLGRSSRTLRRQLQDEGTSFSEVLADVRMVLGCDYMRATALGIRDIALLLGYADESAFSRAFKRSMGKTPREWRNAQAPIR
jgi:AraC-like DNA-binding protein